MTTMTIDQVSAGYGSSPDVIHAVSATFGPGITHITGTNGSGKSTLLEILASNVLPRSGSAHIGSCSVTDPRTRTMRTYVPHEVGLIPALSLHEHVLLAAPDTDEATLARAVDGWGLREWFGAPIEDLSTGNRRKAWLLLCLLDVTDFVLLDEPFNGLDAESVEYLSARIREWAAQQRVVVLVAHALPESLQAARPRVLRLQDGRVRGD